jgi:group I intron endonuclease
VIVYLLSSPSGKNYVGIAHDLPRRLREHKARGHALHAAISKYGIENFATYVLHEVDSWEEAARLEREEIAARDTIAPNGYNLTEGGDGRYGEVHSEAIRRSWEDPEVRDRRLAGQRKVRHLLQENGRRQGLRNRKLSRDQVDEIRRFPKTQVELAAEFGVSQSTISNVQKGVTYGDNKR